MSNVFKLTNGELADALEALPQSEYRNYDVVEDQEELERGYRTIGTIEEFNSPRCREDE